MDHAAGQPCPFRGEVVWLTPEEGGRSSGPPLPRDTWPWPYYAATGYVSPMNPAAGLASFVLRGFREGAWRSEAEGTRLVVDNEGAQRVEPGSVVMVTEGPRVVGRFTVREVTGPA